MQCINYTYTTIHSGGYIMLPHKSYTHHTQPFSPHQADFLLSVDPSSKLCCDSKGDDTLDKGFACI